MRLAQVHVFFYPRMVGGAEWYVYNVSRYLAKKGHDVHVFTADRYEGEQIGLSEEEIEGVKVHRVPLWLDLTYRVKIWKGLRKRLVNGGFDLIHTYDYGQLHSYIAANAAANMGIPVALTIFDVHSLIPRAYYKTVAMAGFDKIFARHVFRNSTKILLRAPNLLEAILNMGADRSKVHVTPSGIVDESLKPADGNMFISKFSLNGSPVVLYLGRLHPSKGLQHIVAAVPRILEAYPDALFVFVGPDHSNHKKQLIKQAETLSVADHVAFTGPVYDFQTKMQAYASADVFTLPSSYEGTSQAVFEAMSQARPIVTTNRGGIPFQVRHGKEALHVNYGDVAKLATSIIHLLGNRRFASKLGENARRRVRKFAYSVLVKHLEEIYQEMLGKTDG